MGERFFAYAQNDSSYAVFDFPRVLFKIQRCYYNYPWRLTAAIPKICSRSCRTLPAAFAGGLKKIVAMTGE